MATVQERAREWLESNHMKNVDIPAPHHGGSSNVLSLDEVLAAFHAYMLGQRSKK